MPKLSLSEQIRQDCETADWIVKEVKKLELQIDRYKQGLRAAAKLVRDWDKGKHQAAYTITAINLALRRAVWNIEKNDWDVDLKELK